MFKNIKLALGLSMQRDTSKHKVDGQPFNAIPSGNSVGIALYLELSAKFPILSFEGPQVDLTFFMWFVGMDSRSALRGRMTT